MHNIKRTSCLYRVKLTMHYITTEAVEFTIIKILTMFQKLNRGKSLVNYREAKGKIFFGFEYSMPTMGSSSEHNLEPSYVTPQQLFPLAYFTSSRKTLYIL